MAPLGPLNSNRLTVRLDAERATQLEFYATQNPMTVRSYNQVLQEALDEFLERHTFAPGRRNLTVSLPEKAVERLNDLKESGFGSFDELIGGAVSSHAREMWREEREYHTLASDADKVRSRRHEIFSEWSRGNEK
ncbi:MAG: hypothetical protein CL960_05035 [Euryarchaeota archaeon]|jgi:hypothetical protein|nr:hypothetical protein [Euryarchaeota archaeon]MDP6363718.1 hypothetical protein [Candidatus Poseidoniia archaeon]MDP6658418.1 hypothetical protein [Candidatus Poseidoniia archaeon]MDP6846087.1 hypothetical protein [Candidatus Poseidoniia archaeon]MDP7006851.1 hypothetical protein [Candidatus Poseidoniia archaeon]|tara:strand:- start:4661 stop:5065 length:405 start_codon:yes stop_codon:yes gene_type:complete